MILVESIQNYYLSAEAAKLPLNFRRLQLTAGFLFSSAQFTQIPILEHLFNPQGISEFHNQEKRNIRIVEEELNSHPKYTPLSPIFTSTPPWLYAKPSIRYDLTSIPKSHNASLFLSELHSILEEYPDHLRVNSKMVKLTKMRYTIFQFCTDQEFSQNS